MSKIPFYREIDGKKFPLIVQPQHYHSAKSFLPGKDDVIVVTYPKCGTTWVLQILALILRKGVPFSSAEEYFAFQPYLEMAPKEKITNLAKPRIIKTHLPFDSLNITSESKYIYVARHPADCLVSFYHHTRMIPFYLFENGNFDDYFDIFVKGETDYGDYFDHLLSGYQNRNKPNVLFLTYESMKSDHRGACLKIAQFIGEDYYEILLENNEEVLKNVVEYSSLDFMKGTISDYWKRRILDLVTSDPTTLEPVMGNAVATVQKAKKNQVTIGGDFIRKGVVGEGKISLSEAQLQRLNDRIREKTAHSDVMNIWKDD